jgi:MYXO-CTERM domain-containing protein
MPHPWVLISRGAVCAGGGEGGSAEERRIRAVAGGDGLNLTFGTALGLVVFAAGDAVFLLSAGRNRQQEVSGFVLAALGLAVLWAARRRVS